MASLKDIDYLAVNARSAFFERVEELNVNAAGIVLDAQLLIDNALRLYLGLPTAEPYSPEFVIEQYRLFGDRVATVTLSNERDFATIEDVIDALKQCGILFVCYPPG